MFIEELFPSENLETKYTEFKGIIKEGPNRDGKPLEYNWLKEIVAFANTEGGNIYVGVEDRSHKVLSLDHQSADDIIKMVHRLIKERIVPTIDYDIIPHPIAGEGQTRYVLQIVIPPSKQRPVMLKADGLLGIYLRKTGISKEASPEEVVSLVLANEDAAFDTRKTDIPFRYEDFTAFQATFLRQRGIQASEKDILSTHGVDQENNLLMGLSLFSDLYHGEKARVACTLWPGVDKSDTRILATDECQANILTGIEFAVDFVKNHSVDGYRKTDIGRENYFSYPRRSVLEGVVNAFVHRNYFLAGKIEVDLFIDRLEITSPGSLPIKGRSGKETDIASIPSTPRNQLLIRILKLLHLMEERGSGFDIIANEYRGYGSAYAPYVVSDEHHFTLVLPNLAHPGGLIHENADPDVYTTSILPGKNDLTILSYCFNHGRSVTEIALKLGVKPSTYFRSETLYRLRDDGYLIESTEDGIRKYTTNRQKAFVK